MNVQRWARALLFLNIVTLLLIGLFLFVGNNPFRPRLRLTIHFDKSAGIHTHSAVEFLGIHVGEVETVSYERDARYPEKPVVVHVAITRLDIKIPDTVQASITPTLLGESLVELGFASGHNASESYTPLTDGKEISGTAASRLEAVIPGFDNTWDQVKDAASKTIDTINAITTVRDQNGKTQLEELVQSLNSLAASLNQPGGNSLASQLGTTIANLKEATDNIRSLVDLQSRRDGTVGEALLEFQKTVEQLEKDAVVTDSVLNKIALASDSVTRAGDRLDILIKETRKELGKTDPILDRVRQIVDEFYSRPSHFLLTTRKPEEQSRTPAHQ